jgi:hypothetical protein
MCCALAQSQLGVSGTIDSIAHRKSRRKIPVKPGDLIALQHFRDGIPAADVSDAKLRLIVIELGLSLLAHSVHFACR